MNSCFQLYKLSQLQWCRVLSRSGKIYLYIRRNASAFEGLHPQTHYQDSAPPDRWATPVPQTLE